MQPKVRAGFSLLHLNSLRVTRAAINATFSTLQRRLLQVDPWLPLDTQVCAFGGGGDGQCCLLVQRASVRRRAALDTGALHAGK